jgi:uncharacterized protein YciI
MKHYLLTYTLAPDYLARRPQFRDAHLALAWRAADRGEIVLAGAALDESGAPDEAVLLFAGEDASAAEAFAASDPYVVNGLVTRWRVREWVTVVGEGCAQPTGQPA